MRDLQQHTGHTRLRVYGEMVDLLWQAGQAAAAIQLEEYWNTLLAAAAACRLFCAYPIDIFSRDFEPAIMAPLPCTHTQVLPAGEALKCAVDLAVEQVFESNAEQLERYGESGWAALPTTLATILWLKDKRPDAADQVLHWARYYYAELE